jgi:hypothetical protein
MDGEDVYLNMVKHIIMFVSYGNEPELWVLARLSQLSQQYADMFRR